MKKGRFVLPVVLAGLAAMAAVPAMADLNPGDTAPDFTLFDSTGVSHTLSDYMGKVIVLANFTST